MASLGFQPQIVSTEAQRQAPVMVPGSPTTSSATHSSTDHGNGAGAGPSTAVPLHPFAIDGSRRGSAATQQSSYSDASASSDPARRAKRAGQPAQDDGADDLPTAAQLMDADNVKLRDMNGQAIPFGAVRRKTKGKTLLLFVRHQHCGYCRLFLMSLCDNPSFRRLAEQQRAQPDRDDLPQVVIISQGSWQGLDRYADFTGALDAETSKPTRNPFQLYSSADRKLFKALGVTKYSWSQGKDETAAKDVRKFSTFRVVLDSLGETLGSGIKGMMHGGDYSLLGADFIIEGDGTASFAHRMRFTRDHTSSEDLARLLGISS